MAKKAANTTQANERDLDVINARLEAIDAQTPAEVQSDEDQAKPLPSVQGYSGQEMSFAEQIAQVDENTAKAEALKIGAAFDNRQKMEEQKNPDNTSIQSTLTKVRAKLAMPSAAAVLIAAQVPADFITRSASKGNTYNVYAADKVADLLGALKGGNLANAINIAICRSLFAFRAAGEPFDGNAAKAACSKQIRVAPKLQKILIQHTVSPGTAPTQSSSTMQALQTLGIVENKGTAKFPVYALTDTPQTMALEQVVARLAA